ncbi:MAG: hypothetical protein ACRCUY_12005 [Thermoguttaceae bacterium]
MIGSTSSINNYMGVFGVSKDIPTNPLAQSSGKNPATKTDFMTLSPTAQMLQQFLSMDGQETGGGDTAELGMTGLGQLKQRGEMLANLLQMKLKSFESTLISNVQSAGLDLPQKMDIKDGKDGLFPTNEMPNKANLEKLLQENKGLRDQFQDVSKLAGLLQMLQGAGGALQSGGIPNNVGSAVTNPSASQYALQSNQTRSAEKPEAEFLVRLMQGSASYTFE